MRTVIFVYQDTFINIATSESNLELCRMSADTAPLQEGDNAQRLAPGIYKIISSQDILITGDTSAFDVTVNPYNKDNDPTPPPPLRAFEIFASLDAAALQAFLAVPDAKTLVNP
jgi:hypothetical protein